MQYLEKAYTEVKAFCLKHQEYRIFKADRMLEIRPLLLLIKHTIPTNVCAVSFRLPVDVIPSRGEDIPL